MSSRSKSDLTLPGLAGYERVVYRDDEVYVIDHDGFKMTWYRDRPQQYSPIPYEKPNVFFVVGGARDTGKSTTLEFLAERYLEHGARVVDLQGEEDGEGLAWLRSPHASKKKVLLLKSPRVEVHRSPCSVIDYTDFSHPLLEEYDIIVNATPLYTSVQEELGAAREVFVRMSARLSWSREAAAVVREAQDLFTSRVYAYEGQKETKGVGVYMVRKSRHFGVATLLDTLKETSIDADIRQLSDYVLFKGVGVWGLPAAFKWVYAYVDPPPRPSPRYPRTGAWSCLGTRRSATAPFPTSPGTRRSRRTSSPQPA